MIAATAGAAHAGTVTACRSQPAQFNFGYLAQPCISFEGREFTVSASYWNGQTDVRMFVEFGSAPFGSSGITWDPSTTTPSPGTLTTRGRDGLYLGQTATGGIWNQGLQNHVIYARTWMTDNGHPYNEAESAPLCEDGNAAVTTC